MKLNFYSDKVFSISILLAISLSTTEVPLWISVISFILVTWRFLYEKYNLPKISPKFSSLIGLLVFAIVYLEYRSIFGQEESTSVLLGLTSVTILNYEKNRDKFLLTLLGFFLICIKSFFSIELMWIPIGLISFTGIWYSLLSKTKSDKYKLLFKIWLRSLPLLAVLFLAFPRFVIFQKERVRKYYNKSGFSESLNPGQVSELAMQNQTVFRVQFDVDTKISKPQFSIKTQDLYWRGSILTLAHGLSWTKDISRIKKVPPKSFTSTDNVIPIKYSVVLDTLNIRNIFPLDTPVQILSSSIPIQPLVNHLYILAETPDPQVHFEALSLLPQQDFSLASLYSDENNLEINNLADPYSEEYSYYTKVPALPEKSQKLVESINQRFSTPEEKLLAVIHFFKDSDLIYTLKPGFYKNNIDDFLFDRKKGFCEHFTAAFSTLTRALGIPSRVIVGYHGGQYNSFGNFWTVSQKDAHAWTEVYLNGSWQRIDPTSLVAPLRLSIGGYEFFSLSEEEQILFAKQTEFTKKTSFFNIFDDVTNLFEDINYRWTLMLLNFDLQFQMQFLKQFKGHWSVAVIFALLILSFIFFNRQKTKKSLLSNKHLMYDFIIEIENWARQNDIPIKTSHSPLDSLRIIALQYPDLQNILTQVSHTYENVVYKNTPIHNEDSAAVNALKKQWQLALKSINASSSSLN